MLQSKRSLEVNMFKPDRPSPQTIFTPPISGPCYTVEWKFETPAAKKKLKVFRQIDSLWVEPKKFVDVDKTSIQSLKRGVGVKYHLRRTSKGFCRGVILARRGLDLFIDSFGKERDMFRIISIGVYHPSWNNYEFQRVMRKLARLEKTAKTSRKLIQVLQQLWKRSDGWSGKNSDFSAEAGNLANKNKLSDGEHLLVVRYADWLNQLRRVQKQLTVK